MICNYCNVDCDTAQHYCSNSIGQSPSSFGLGSAGAPTVAKDDIIIRKLPLSEFNRLIRWLNNVAGYVQDGTGEKSTTVTVSEQTTKFISASKTNEVIDLIKRINPAYDPGVTAKKDDIISATFFNKIFSSMNNLKFSPSKCPKCIQAQCGICVTECQVCNSCNVSNTCEQEHPFGP